MAHSAQFRNPSAAARQLGVSTKALRIYEQRGLIEPTRTAAGWRTYGPAEITRAAEIVALRALGFSLDQVSGVMGGCPQGLEPTLATHQATLEAKVRQLAETVEKIGAMRVDLGQGKAPMVGDLLGLGRPTHSMNAVFELPWPWGGEEFELNDIRPLNYITGPLGSGKTRLARAIAETLPAAAFLGLDRTQDDDRPARAQMEKDVALNSRVEKALKWLVEDGAEISESIVALLVELESVDNSVLVVDMIEQGLKQPAQEALIAYLRCRGPDARTLFLLTRSNAILDLDAVGADETIIFCPANHSPPIKVMPYRGTPGYEAVATCLASPEVRKRTEGVIAIRPQVA